jgi:hypothetical protein
MSNPADGRGAPQAEGGPMTYLTTTNSPGDADTFRKVLERVGPHAEGLVARYAGTNERGLVVTSIWQSKAQADRFATERLLPALHEVVGDDLSGGTMIDCQAFDEYHGDHRS